MIVGKKSIFFLFTRHSSAHLFLVATISLSSALNTWVASGGANFYEQSMPSACLSLLEIRLHKYT